MLRFSKKVEYALIAMVNMDEVLPQNELVTSKSVSSQFHIPPDIMGKVLQALVRNGLLISVQGVKGGYTISRPLDKISILEIIEAIDGTVSLMSCAGDSYLSCDQAGLCGIQTPMEIIQNELAGFFERISLQDIKNKYNNTSKVLNA